MAQESVTDLPEAESVEEKLVRHFDPFPEQDEEQPQTEETELPESTDEDSETEDETPSPFEEIEFEGKVYQVPSELKDALMSKSDYTQKTQQLARNRENLELQQQQIKEFFETQKFEESLSEELGQLQHLKGLMRQYKGLNWSEMQDAEMMRRNMEKGQIQEAINELQSQVDAKRTEFKSKQEGRLKEILSKASEQLGRLIPNWDEAKAADVSEYALGQGYTNEEVENVVNPRDIHVLWKAMQYDKLLSTKTEALKKASKAPPVVKPGSVKRMPKDVRDKLDFKKQMDKAKKKNASEGEQARIIRQRLEKRYGAR